jgi:hypothetical protein
VILFGEETGHTDGGGGGLVDDSENGQTGDGTSVLGSGSLSVVEI